MHICDIVPPRPVLGSVPFLRMDKGFSIMDTLPYGWEESWFLCTLQNCTVWPKNSHRVPASCCGLHLEEPLSSSLCHLLVVLFPLSSSCCPLLTHLSYQKTPNKWNGSKPSPFLAGMKERSKLSCSRCHFFFSCWTLLFIQMTFLLPTR